MACSAIVLGTHQISGNCAYLFVSSFQLRCLGPGGGLQSPIIVILVISLNIHSV
jgi:hypothetical protein